jgi:predicted lipoprotein with Yx(FWY)xxD motif
VVTSWNNPRYGDILTGADGHVLYIYLRDRSTAPGAPGNGHPQCTGSCAEAWPPLAASDPHLMRAAGDVRQELLSWIDGQVAYNTAPLYFCACDTGPHETNGQGASGLFYVIDVNGHAIMTL